MRLGIKLLLAASAALATALLPAAAFASTTPHCPPPPVVHCFFKTMTNDPFPAACCFKTYITMTEQHGEFYTGALLRAGQVLTYDGKNYVVASAKDIFTGVHRGEYLVTFTSTFGLPVTGDQFVLFTTGCYLHLFRPAI